ncbi:MAG: CoA-binding protein [Candidatus Omnitrophota bacterium]|nr:CoA-binding protein [Candidatus Omnitrophota bacterium]
MESLVKEFLAQKKFAVIGSFRNESKYAYKILKKLKSKGYEVYPVNPGVKEVEGVICYPSVKNIPVKIDVANLVTPAPVTEKIVIECKENGINRVWLQPGAENENTIKYCEENNMKVIYQACIMLNAI